jgi:putative ABC transport system substrate-binding protein
VPLPAEVQQTARIWRIGYLSPLTGPSSFEEAFRLGLRDLGYVEGKNLSVEYRWAGGTFERLPDLAAELVRLEVDLIVARGTPSVRAAKGATTTIPIVMPISNDAVGDGLVASLARPGGNVTGLTLMATELSGKRLELLKEAFPRIVRVAVLYDPDLTAHARELRETEVAAERLRVALQPVRIEASGDVERAFASMSRVHAEALITFGASITSGQLEPIVKHAARNRLPAIYAFRDFVDGGGLMSYGPSLQDSFRRAAAYVDKILKGAKPADLPVEQPAKFELVINLKTAKALGLTIPASLLLRADHVIQ